MIMHSVCPKRIQFVRGWCATVKRDCVNCIHLTLPLRRPGPPFFGGEASHATRQLLAGDIESNPGPKPTLKPFYTHSLNTLIHQYNPLNPPHPHSPQPTHRLTHPHLSNPIFPLCKTRPHTTEHIFCTHLYTSNNILPG